MNWKGNLRDWKYWLAGCVAAAAVITLAVMAGMTGNFSSPPQPPVQQYSTFTYEGVTWNCNQVEAWDQQYGAYEPDGTPIPEYVVLGCDVQSLP